MKSHFTILSALCWQIVGQSVHAQTINWGSEMFSSLVDSAGQTLDDSYVFELGAFETGFEPVEGNANDWAAHWQTFDRAVYNGVEVSPAEDDGVWGYFTSSVQMLANGHSSNPAYTNLGMDFQELDAYLWVSNGSVSEPGTQWLLARAEGWKFPTYKNCCEEPSAVPSIQWSVSDMTNHEVTPVWGNQDGHIGAGIVSVTNSAFTLQTAIVPEPTSACLLGLGAFAAVMRRRRSVI
ncbi:MAG: hypothetical protein RLZZ282_146 [Verrucomicrobiota bacterium]|jgi:hypothetical protein